MLTDKDREWLSSVTSSKRRRSPMRTIFHSIIWEIPLGFLVVLGFLGWVLWQDQEKAVTPATVAFVVVGWIFSLCLHEFGHAAVAFLGGDNSDGTISYLSFNPLRYINPVMSIILPVVFILLGGIGLPGGAVYINRNRIRSSTMQSLVSLAGPIANAICALLLAIPFLLFPDFGYNHPDLAGAMAVLAFFQVFAVILNLLPIPPLDGFGVIAPYLSPETQIAAYNFGLFGLIILFILLWEVPAVYDFLDTIIITVLQWGHIAPEFVGNGLYYLFFWQH